MSTIGAPMDGRRSRRGIRWGVSVEAMAGKKLGKFPIGHGIVTGRSYDKKILGS